MSAPRRANAPLAVRIARTGAAFAIAIALALIAAPRDVRAACIDPNLLGPVSPNTGYILGAAEEYGKMNISLPYWTGMVVFPNNHSTDYDVYVYSNGSGGSAPFCFSGLLANSTYGAGHTDFVVGDFNHNPAGTYYMLGHCYSGTCASLPTDGIWGWRDGDLVTVNAAPTSQYIDPSTDFPDQMLHCYDVYLTAGTTYFFHFTNTGPNDIKMCLFHNTTNGVYWAGRSSAVFEVTSCATYQAPSTGYYGIAIVTDARYNVADTYTVAVSTTPDCNCPADLSSGVPQTELATQTYGMHRATQPDPYWMAVGTRAAGTSDWDIDLGPPTGASDACLSGVDGASAQGPPNADVVAGDFNFGTLPYTEAVQTNRFSGSDGASTELDAGPNSLIPNGYKVTGAMNANDVVKIWDSLSGAGDSLTYELQSFGANINLLLFENTAGTRVWKSRSNAVMTTNGKQAFKTTVTGYHGVALVKDDGNSGSYLLRYGSCDTPLPLTSRVLDGSYEQRWYSISEPDTVWTAACVFNPVGAIFGPAIDSDIQQADAPTGSAWPDCFGSLGALSQSSTQMDFVVGDFHHQPLGTEYIHSYPFTANMNGGGYTEWDAGRGTLKINAAPTVVALTDSIDAYADRLFCYQVYLQAGEPYTFEFSQTGTVDTHLMLFRNPGTTEYWAPRSAALLSTTANQPFTPAGAGATGWYAVVVTNENVGGGSFSVRVSSTVVGVPDAGAPIATRLTRVAPNPARGAVRIEYAKAATDAVAFEVLDMAGRIVARIAAPDNATTEGSVTWDRRMPAGTRVPAGVYFVRMRVGGRSIDTRKVALIE
jgi:hypothetical protein